MGSEPSSEGAAGTTTSKLPRLCPPGRVRISCSRAGEGWSLNLPDSCDLVGCSPSARLLLQGDPPHVFCVRVFWIRSQFRLG